MVGACGRQEVRPFRKVRREQGAGKGQVKTARHAHPGHGEMSKHPCSVQEGAAQVSGPVEVRNRGSQFVLFERSERVSGGVVDVEVAQGEDGAREDREDKFRGN